MTPADDLPITADASTMTHETRDPSALSLVRRDPTVEPSEMVGHLVPPPQFAHATLEGYRPDSAHPSQQEAVDAVERFLAGPGGGGGGLFRKRRAAVAKPGIYLDGGFGVGKTHLLAALWHAHRGPKRFGTFIEYTALVGALGYQGAVDALRGSALLCIDEFELDDPGDTMIMSRLLGELVAGGTRVAATSNTPPNALGEGRFAAADFLREIQALADRFEILRIDGLDYRRRDAEGSAVVTSAGELEERMRGLGSQVADDGFEAVVQHLAQVHPSKYSVLVAGLDGVVLRDVVPLHDQAQALRFVALVDRLYDAQVPVVATGAPLDEVFAGGMLTGGYRKKYLRAISRLIALTSAGASG